MSKPPIQKIYTLSVQKSWIPTRWGIGAGKQNPPLLMPDAHHYYPE
ncbi:MAG: hypothetical protein COB30_007180 [Ectothiorhodospiraceae bacterium]|nr:hypothetical protein [Ectothiorhodospiraceae bacterium]